MASLINREILNVWAIENPQLRPMKNSVYGELLLESYAKLDTDVLFKSYTHGQGHIERTMLLGALIAHGESMSERDAALVLLCCSYHDVGRINDWGDREHGARSAEQIVSGQLKQKFAGFDREELEMALGAITAHSMSDRDIPRIIKDFGIGRQREKRFMGIVRALKDADNLDRVRIGDLDESYLRTDTAKKLPYAAKWILKRYSSLED